MKITTTPLVAGAQRHPAEKAPGGAPADFRQVFDAVRNGGVGRNQRAASQVAAPVASPLGIDAIGVQPATTGIQRVERLIDALAAYQQCLEDPHCRLREVAPALERLEAEQRQLAGWMETAAPADAPLRDIANQGLVTAALEINRFHSGLYC